MVVKILGTIYSTFFTWCCFSYVHFLNCICLACIVVILSVFVVSYVYLQYLTCICCTMCVLRSYFRCRTVGQKSVSGRSCDRPPRHRFSWFPCVYKRRLRWFPSFQVAPTCLSNNPPNLNFLVTFPHICVHVK